MKIVSKEIAERIKNNPKAILLSMETDDDFIGKFQCTRDESHIFYTKIYNVANGSGCTYCKYANHYSDEQQFKARLSRTRDDVVLYGEYKGMKEETLFKCNKGDDHIFWAIPKNLLMKNVSKRKNCTICVENAKKEKSLSKLMVKAKENGYTIVGDYMSWSTDVECVCDKNPKHIFFASPNGISHGKKCPECKEETKYAPVKKGYIKDSRPDMVELLLDKNDANIYSASSGRKTWFVCPDCGEKKYLKICQVSNSGISCDICSCNNSYPNRLMSLMLKKSSVEFIPEFHPSWAKGKRYDFYFEMDGKKYVVEMDGAFHYENIYGGLGDAEEADRIKDEMATSHGINVIRIDCFYKSKAGRFEYIKASIQASGLCDIIGFDIKDCKECDLVASTPMLKRIADIWNSGNKTLRGVKSELECSYSIDDLSLLVKKAVQYRLIHDSIDDVNKMIKDEGYRIAAEKQREFYRKNGRKVICVETQEVFDYPLLAANKYGYGVYGCLSGNQAHAGRLPDGTKLSWKYA